MPHQFDSWESYFYPETYNAQTRNGVLRNIPDIRDAAALRTYDGSVAKIVKLEHAWRRLDGRNDDGFQVAPFPG